jgi:TolB protein
MIERTDLDRAMTSYFESRTTSRAPDGLLDAALTRVETTRQRPAMLVAERWLPADLSGAARLRTGAIVALTVALLVATAVTVGLIVGSQHRLPPPFGLAKPGLVSFDMNGHVFVANPDGTELKQLTSGQLERNQTFSPDGSWIVYESKVDDLSSAIIVMSPDGDRRVTIADNLAEVGDLVWSPDSRRVAFAGRIVGLTGFRIFTADIAHPGAVRLGGPDLFGWAPSWSPDGRQIAFKRLEWDDGKPYTAGTLWRIDVDGSNLKQLTSMSGGGNAYWNTAWSPDGTRLAFLGEGQALRFDVFVISADGTDLRNISNSQEDEYWPSWSPDGTRIAFPRMSLTKDNQGQLIVVDLDGSHPIALDGPPVNSNTPVWSPDGRQLIGYAKNPDPTQDYNVAIAVFDASNKIPPTTFSASHFGSASWQRLAP